jgi:uncharacterized protein YutE (UPF0331/DUF86 family)
MKSLNVDRLRLRLGAIADALRRLRELGALGEETFLADFRNTESAKYLLIVVIEAAIDICNHIVARGGGRSPQDYADCFEVLSELGVLKPALVERLKRMARFRNLVVHLYWQVDNRLVYRVICEDLEDLETFGQEILDWLAL